MRKILEISADDFLKNGISANQYSTEGGLFWRAPGCDPFLVPGLMIGGATASQLTGVGGEIMNFFVQGLASSSFVTMYGASGGINRLNLTDDSVSQLRSVPNSQGQEMVLWRGELRYARDSALGKATSPDGDGPAFTDDYKQWTYNKADHPLHVFQGNLFQGDGNLVHYEDSNGQNEAKLTLPPDYTIVDIDDDGYYLVIAAVKKGGSSMTRVENKIYYWDTVSPNFNFEWDIEEGEITAIGRTTVGRFMKAFTGAGLYYFSFQDAPDAKVPGSGSTYAPFGTTDLQPARGGVNFWKGQEAWAANGRFWTHGRVLPKTSKIFAQPTTLTNIKAFYVNAFAQIYASTTDGTLYKIASGNLSPTIETNLIQLPAPMDIKGIRLFLGDALTAGTSVQIQVTGEVLGSADISETFNSTNSGTSNRVLWRPTGNLKAEYVRLLLTANSGANIRKVELWGDPIANPLTYAGIT